jgi:uncharacterized protein (TIGR02145 family)
MSNVVETRCGTGWNYYDASNVNKRCDGYNVETRCGTGTSWYDTTNTSLWCNLSNNVVETRCGNGDLWYDAADASLSCPGYELLKKCGVENRFEWYKTAYQRCNSSNVIETRCGESVWYDSTNVNKRCYNNVVETKCGTGYLWYDAANNDLRCQSNVVETKCGASWYDKTNTNLRCESDVVETKCGDDWYDATDVNLSCQYGYIDGNYGQYVETKCGEGWYNAVYQRCGASNVIETKCGTNWYNANITTLRCQDDVVETRCGTSSYYWYDINNTGLRCENNVVETICGTSSYWYNINNTGLRCENNVVETSCGTDWYNAIIEYCSNGTKEIYGSVTDDNEQTYNTIVIGTQTWMAENLNYAVSGSKCYGDEEANCDKYGRLYDWATAMGFATVCNSNLVSNISCGETIDDPHKGICPEGWHIPSASDWDELMEYVQVGNGSTYSSGTTASIAGKHLKSKKGWISYYGEDTYGFAALPGGYSYDGSSFYREGEVGLWWSSMEFSYYQTRYRYMTSTGDYASWGIYGTTDKSSLFSVRCVKDTE